MREFYHACAGSIRCVHMVSASPEAALALLVYCPYAYLSHENWNFTPMMHADTQRILIIDDEKPIAHALELKLMHEGYDVALASDGEAALALLEKEHFDLVLCDLVMPKADGFRVLQEVNAKRIKTPVIVLSNLSQKEDKEKVLALGAKEFFVKSDIPLADLVGKIKSTLARA